MDRKEFIQQVGSGAVTALLIACGVGCKKKTTTPTPDPTVPAAPTNVDFTIDVSTGPLATNGGSLYQNGIIVARTNAGAFLAVSQACTHQGTTINFAPFTSSFLCPNHGAKYSSTGVVTLGPASTNLTKYNTTLNGSSLRVFS